MTISTNTRALAFYTRHGWTAPRTYRHERNPIDMTELRKQLG